MYNQLQPTRIIDTPERAIRFNGTTLAVMALGCVTMLGLYGAKEALEAGASHEPKVAHADPAPLALSEISPGVTMTLPDASANMEGSDSNTLSYQDKADAALEATANDFVHTVVHDVPPVEQTLADMKRWKEEAQRPRIRPEVPPEKRFKESFFIDKNRDPRFSTIAGTILGLGAAIAVGAVLYQSRYPWITVPGPGGKPVRQPKYTEDENGNLVRLRVEHVTTRKLRDQRRRMK